LAYEKWIIFADWMKSIERILSLIGLQQFASLPKFIPDCSATANVVVTIAKSPHVVIHDAMVKSAKL
jgi:hypothetical protein